MAKVGDKLAKPVFGVNPYANELQPSKFEELKKSKTVQIAKKYDDVTTSYSLACNLLI